MKKVVAIVALMLTFIVGGCNSGTQNQSNPDEMDESAASNGVVINQTAMPETGEEIVVFETNKGVIRARLFPDAVPESYQNFVYHVREGNYDGTIFHRVINDFMIQGGDFEKRDGTGGYSYKGPGTSIDTEYHPGLTHLKGALSMANKGIPMTTGSQFFIVQREEGTAGLDGRHTVFGQAFEGLDIVDEIAGVATDANDKPLDDIVLEKAYLVEYSAGN